jgi:hypothetical protein
MDSSEIAQANGIHCSFTAYEIFKDEHWVKVINGIPTKKDRIRAIERSTVDV